MAKIRYVDIPQRIARPSTGTMCGLTRIIKTIDAFVTDMGLDLNPDFQRDLVWTNVQKTRFMEYILTGGRDAHAVTIYMNYPSWHSAVPVGEYNDFVLVDGKQRLQAIRDFFDEKIFPLGLRASDIEGASTHLGIWVAVNDLRCKADVLRWYIDMNAGGTVHTDGEIEKVRKLLEKEKHAVSHRG